MRILPGIVLALSLYLAPYIAQADTVNARATATAENGRLVLDWPAEVEVFFRMSGNAVTLTFSRAIETDLTAARRQLQDFISDTRIDGTRLTLTLKGKPSVKGTRLGDAVIVEFKKSSATAQEAPPATPAPAPATAPSSTPPPSASTPAANIRVRTGDHDGYSRIVFDWTQAGVQYKLNRTVKALTITFDRPATLSPRFRPATPARYIANYADGARTADARAILEISPNSRVKDFRSGTKIVLDVFRPGPSPLVTAPEEPTAPEESTDTPPDPRTPPTPVDLSTVTPEPAPEPAPVTPPETTEKPEAAPAAAAETEVAPAPEAEAAAPPETGAEPSPPDATDTTPASPAAAPEPAPVESLETPDTAEKPSAPEAVTETPETPESLPTEMPAAVPETAPESPPTSSEAAEPAAPGATPEAPDTVVPTPSEAAAPEIPAPTSTPPSGEMALGENAATPEIATAPDTPPAPEDGFTMRFNWDEPVASAVFRRADALWVVFDKSSAPNLVTLAAAGGDAITSIEQVASPQATALRILTTDETINPVLQRDGLAWILQFGDQNLSPQTNLTPRVEARPGAGLGLFIDVTESTYAIPLRDPEVGDILLVVPVIPLGHGMPTRSRFPEFDLLATAQGIVVKPYADGLQVQPLRQGINISSATGLALSDPASAKAASGRLVADRALTRVFDFAGWARGGLENFYDNRTNLTLTVATGAEDQRQQARLALAQLLLANGMGPEAAGVLRVIESHDETLRNDSAFRGLLGVSAYLNRNYAQAVEEFEFRSLQDEDETKFWHAAALAEMGDFEAAAPVLQKTGAIIRPYPTRLKFPLATAAIDASLKANQVQQAMDFLELIKSDPLTDAQKAELAFLEGRALVQDDKGDEGIAKWEEAMAYGDRRITPLASYALTEYLHNSGRINDTEALDRIDALRYSWRGDDFEFGLLRRLGDLYFATRQYGKGLDTLRHAATHFRDHPGQVEVTEDMADVFRKLYLDGEAKTLPPMVAIGLFRKFKELLPTGKDGDTMIRNLADRMVAIDLLEQAAEMLDGQINARLSGEERASIGARLALIRLLDQKYIETINVLNKTEQENIPATLADVRRKLRARALLEAGQGDDALTLLEGDDSVDAERLRMEIYWYGRDWDRAAKSLRRLIAAMETKPNAPLNDVQAKYVLNLAVALTLAGNDRGIAQLRKNFASSMVETRYQEPFNLITAPGADGIADYTKIASELSDVEGFQDFMSDYKKRLAAGDFDIIR
ncbi:MAG: hypothetical protein ACPGO3_06640 [Magnetospiraceae bacterium]